MSETLELIEDLRRYRSAGVRGGRLTICDRAAGELERLLNLLCLADEALMLSHGCFPLDPGPLREACLLIRADTGEQYNERKRRAALAKEETDRA